MKKTLEYKVAPKKCKKCPFNSGYPDIEDICVITGEYDKIKSMEKNECMLLKYDCIKVMRK